MVRQLGRMLDIPDQLSVLDAGCGEGKNAAYFALRGAHVRAMDISRQAILNARTAWGPVSRITWEVGDIRIVELPQSKYDVVIAYGLLHCLRNEIEIEAVVDKLKGATKSDGYHVICAFNSRTQDLSAHPGFTPCLAAHTFYTDLYADWDLIECSDSNLTETHPHNQITHMHSLTRLIARKAR